MDIELNKILHVTRWTDSTETAAVCIARNVLYKEVLLITIDMDRR